MDWLKSAAQAAFAKGNSIPNLPNFGLGDREHEYDGLTIWQLYSGTKRDDDSAVSVFVYDAALPSSSRTDRRTLLLLAKNALKKLRTLRHPDIIRFLDGAETDSAVYIVTEPVVPLSTRIGRDGEVKCNSSSAVSQGTGEEWRIWGLSKITNALSFINDSVQATHGNLRLSSVFVAPGGDWRLGGFELQSSDKDQYPTLYHYGSLVPQANMFTPPEARQAGFSALKEQEPHAYDSFLLYLFIHLLFNGPLPTSSLSETPTARGQIPPSLFPHVRRLCPPNGPPNARQKSSALYAAGTSPNPPGPFRSNRLVHLAEGLDGFALASEGERAALVRNIKECLPDASSQQQQQHNTKRLPTEFLKHKVLPALVKNFELPSGGPQLLPLILAMSSELKQDEYEKHVLPSVIRAFSSPDRAMRMAVLDGLPTFIDRIEKRVVTDKIWPNLLTGFSDVVPVIREATVKSILVLAPKLSDRILNNDLLRLLAKTQTDSEPGIRTNTCILLGRLASHLTPSTASKVLVPAYGRAMRDPFVHARIAGLMALMATAEGFSKEDLAGRILPSMGITLVDGEKVVRDQAFKAIEMILKRLGELTKSMPDSVLPPEQANPMQRAATPNGTAVPQAPAAPATVSSSGGAAGALAGWAMSSMARRLATSDLQTGIPGQKAESRIGELPNRPGSTPNASAPAASTAPEAPAATSASGGNSLQASGSSSWGGDDLMDVNSGGDDWDPLDGGVEADAPVPIEELAPLPPGISAARLSTTPSKKPAKAPASTSSKARQAPPAKQQGALKLGASAKKPSKALQEIEADLLPEDDWGLNESNQDGWDDPVSADPSPPVVTASLPTKASSKPQPKINTDAPATDDWNEQDDAWGSTSKPAVKPVTSPALSNSSGSTATAGKSKVAQMREERKARLAAMKGSPSPSPPISTPPPQNSTFRSGAQTQYRF